MSLACLEQKNCCQCFRLSLNKISFVMGSILPGEGCALSVSKASWMEEAGPVSAGEVT